MWKSLGQVLNCTMKERTALLAAESIIQSQFRNTYILKRKFPVSLHKKGQKPKTLKSRHYVYDLVRQTDAEPHQKIDVILTSYVDGLGNVGEKVSLKPNFAYNNILLPGLGTYASPENMEKYKDYEVTEVERHSSPYALLAAKSLARMVLSVVMNMDTPWTLKSWHVKASFRKCGYIVPEDAITLPEKPIEGPDMNLEDKEFFVIVTINNLEKVNVRCRIHHWSTDVINRIPYKPYFWEEPKEAIFPEQAPVLENLPKKPSKRAL